MSNRFRRSVVGAALLLALTPTPAVAAGGAGGGGFAVPALQQSAGNTIEQAAHRASETGRKVALSLIALGFAVAAIVLAFRRDFKEAVAVFAIGVVAVLFAQESGLHLIENLVRSLVG